MFLRTHNSIFVKSFFLIGILCEIFPPDHRTVNIAYLVHRITVKNMLINRYSDHLGGKSYKNNARYKNSRHPDQLVNFLDRFFIRLHCSRLPLDCEAREMRDFSRLDLDLEI